MRCATIEAEQVGAARHSGWAALAVALAAAAACTVEERDIDPFPVDVDLTNGAVMAFAASGDDEPVPVTIDTLNPITLLDSFRPGGGLPPESRRAVDLTLYSAPAAGDPVPRITMTAATVFDTHPCLPDNGTLADCLVGVGDQTAVTRGIIGADLLSHTAVRFDFASSTMRFFPDTAGTDTDRGELCEAVFDRPFGGGGTIIVADGEVDYFGLRPALGACLDSGPSDALEERGVDALMVLATGIGISVLAESSYERYAKATGAPAYDTLPEAVVQLPWGPATARLGTIGQIALTGDIGSDSQRRGPCGELYANRVLAYDDCNSGAVAPCPCPNGDKFCRAAAALILTETIDVAIVPDGTHQLQALRFELRPEFPELDGLLGASALAATRIEMDYPNGRIVARCEDPDRCLARRQILTRNELSDVQRCLPPRQAITSRAWTGSR